MLATAISRSWAQSLHPAFRSVLFKSIATSFVTLALLTAAFVTFMPDSLTTGYAWIDGIASSLIITASWYLLFPAIITALLSFFMDQIAFAVESDYYPHRIGERKVPLADMLASALKLMIKIILVNSIAFIPYLILFFTTGGLGTLALYLLINGYLLGHEYFEMVIIRHIRHRDIKALQRPHKSDIYWSGALIAGLFLIPIVNIIAPLYGAAIMTHTVHLKHMLDRGESQMREKL